MNCQKLAIVCLVGTLETHESKFARNWERLRSGGDGGIPGFGKIPGYIWRILIKTDFEAGYYCYFGFYIKKC
jgi:hypothetical protein